MQRRTCALVVPRPGVGIAGATLVACLLALAACAHRPDPPAVDLAIVGATVIDPRDGSRHVGQTVLVDAGRVVAMGSAATVAVPAATHRIDAHGRFMLPGLWDMHVHALWDPVVRKTFLPLFVAHGVTGIRDMGGTLEVLALVRAEAASSTRPWPRIIAAGPVLDGPEPVDPSISIAIGSAQEARAAVNRLQAAGVDFIKVYTLLPPDAYRAAVEQAARYGLPLVGHVPHGIDAREAAAGMRSIEHLRAETGGLCAGMSTAECDDVLVALREHHVWQVPTLLPRRARATIDAPGLATDDRLALLPATLRKTWLANRASAIARLSPEQLQARRSDYDRERNAVGALPARGIPMLAGSDAGADFAYPGVGLHDELLLLVEAGLTPLQALQGATIEPARFLGRKDTGWIGVGSVADLVLLDADPLLDIRNTRRIRAVVLDGRWMDRNALDSLLRDVGEAAR